MNLLVLGNGFDIAHGMPTQYSDFLCFVGLFIKHFELYPSSARTYSIEEKFRIFDLNNMNNCLSILKTDDPEKYSSLETIFKEISPLLNTNSTFTDIIKNNTWLRYFFFSYKKLLERGTNWVDLENEISNLLLILNDKMSDPGQFISWLLESRCLTNHPTLSATNSISYNDFCMSENQSKYIYLFNLKTFSDHYKIKTSTEEDKLSIKSFASDQTFFNNLSKKFFSYLYDELQNFSILLKNYLSLLEQMNIPLKYDFSKADPTTLTPIDTLLTFNYTNTFSKYYSLPNCIDFINGKLTDDQIILGIENPCPDKLNHYCDNGTYKFFKNTQRINNNISIQYSSWLDTPQIFTHIFQKSQEAPSNRPIPIPASSQTINVFIIGHSLDICDKSILEKVILAAKNITIFYYSEDDRQDKICKIFKLLGEEQIAKSVNDPAGYPYIIFKDLKEIEISS